MVSEPRHLLRAMEAALRLTATPLIIPNSGPALPSTRWTRWKIGSAFSERAAKWCPPARPSKPDRTRPAPHIPTHVRTAQQRPISTFQSRRDPEAKTLRCAVSRFEASEPRWRGFGLTCPVDPEILGRFSGMSWHRVKAGCQHIFLC